MIEGHKKNPLQTDEQNCKGQIRVNTTKYIWQFSYKNSFYYILNTIFVNIYSNSLTCIENWLS